LDGNYPGNASTRLIRHTTFVVPNVSENPRLRFWHWYSVSSDDEAVVQIRVSGGEWETISEIYNNTSGGVWTYPMIDLSAYSGSTVEIAFYFKSGTYNSSTGWYIDDISILTGSKNYNNPEDWELGVGDWYAERGSWEIGTPSSGPNGAYAGQYSPH